DCNNVESTGRQRTETKIPVCICGSLHNDSIDASRVGLFDGHKDVAGDGSLRGRVDNLSANPGIVGANLTRSECGFQAECAVSFVDNRRACVEVNVEIDALSSGDLDGASNDLTWRNFQSRVVLAAEL